jgi:hypothetical protein
MLTTFEYILAALTGLILIPLLVGGAYAIVVILAALTGSL